MSRALHTSIHNYLVNGKKHFANAIDPQVPAALAGVVSGFLGLHDFTPKPALHPIPIGNFPDYNSSGGSHALAPADFATIYDLNPLYTAGFDGTGQSIAIVGESDILITDIRGFRNRFSLPVNDPKMVPYGADPGFNDAQFEGNLDVEWSGAVAPRATIYYVYGANVFTALSFAVNTNTAPVISESYAGCEIDDAPFVFRTVLQQANAQGITVLNSSGDSGGGSCDAQGVGPLSTLGLSVNFPVNLPEVTGVGGTMFNDSTGAYWGPRNSPNLGSALSYIPEIAWNENSLADGLLAGGGGASRFFSKPDWQSGPGVPNDGARDVPDIALSAAVHDPYLVTYQSPSALYGVGGTSASSPSMAGIVAILNQYVVKQGFQKTAGLGNINPQLYRLAQSAPAAFHDITSGNNIVPCEQGSPDCLTGSFGYAAGPGYDQATGLGSIDANVFITSWNMAVSPVSMTLTSSAATVTLNDAVTLTATVASATGAGTPAGTVSFFAYGVPLGSAVLGPVAGAATASVTAPAWMLSTGNNTITAQYAGNAAFSSGAASLRLRVTLPTAPNVSAVIPVVASPVYGIQTGTQGTVWQAYITLQEVAGVPAALTGFTVDGAAQSLSQYFPSTSIPAGGALNATIVFNNLAVPVTRTFGFTGTDASGLTWSRQIQVGFLPIPVELNFNLWAAPLTMQQNTSAPASCPWSQQVIMDETGGSALQLVTLYQGAVDITSRIASIFGTTRLAPWGSIQGTLCWSGVAAPATDMVFAQLADDFGDVFSTQLNVSFAAPPATPVQLSATPLSLTLKPQILPSFQQPVTVSVNLSDKSQPWTASVYPANRTTSWLQLSQYSGTGPATVMVQASATGFEPGAYRATIVFQSPNSVPQWVEVPVMWINGPAGPTISSVGNALSFAPGASPGSLLAVYGSQLAGTTQSATTLPLSLSMAGVSATVNGWPAPLLYVSPTQLNLQVPFEAGAGPAVLGINNNGQIGGFLLQVAPTSPGILADASGNVLGAATAKAGAYATLYVTGFGDVSPTIEAGVPVTNGTPAADDPLPLLPLSVSVGGAPALIQFSGVTPGVIGLAQVNFLVPASLGTGVQKVVVTSGGVASAPANLTVTM
jgi:uncharacterized protein (TIGR03437 family)